jgi:hypothetical protein
MAALPPGGGCALQDTKGEREAVLIACYLVLLR